MILLYIINYFDMHINLLKKNPKLFQKKNNIQNKLYSQYNEFVRIIIQRHVPVLIHA